MHNFLLQYSVECQQKTLDSLMLLHPRVARRYNVLNCFWASCTFCSRESRLLVSRIVDFNQSLIEEICSLLYQNKDAAAWIERSVFSLRIFTFFSLSFSAVFHEVRSLLLDALSALPMASVDFRKAEDTPSQKLSQSLRPVLFICCSIKVWKPSLVLGISSPTFARASDTSLVTLAVFPLV